MTLLRGVCSGPWLLSLWEAAPDLEVPSRATGAIALRRMMKAKSRIVKHESAIHTMSIPALTQMRFGVEYECARCLLHVVDWESISIFVEPRLESDGNRRDPYIENDEGDKEVGRIVGRQQRDHRLGGQA